MGVAAFGGVVFANLSFPRVFQNTRGFVIPNGHRPAIMYESPAGNLVPDDFEPELIELRQDDDVHAARNHVRTALMSVSWYISCCAFLVLNVGDPPPKFMNAMRMPGISFPGFHCGGAKGSGKKA